jgi:hypothetical protein
MEASLGIASLPAAPSRSASRAAPVLAWSASSTAPARNRRRGAEPSHGRRYRRGTPGEALKYWPSRSRRLLGDCATVLDAIERRAAVAVPVLQHVSGNPAEHCERSTNDKDPRSDVHRGAVCLIAGLAVYRLPSEGAPSSTQRRLAGDRPGRCGGGGRVCDRSGRPRCRRPRGRIPRCGTRQDRAAGADDFRGGDLPGGGAGGVEGEEQVGAGCAAAGGSGACRPPVAVSGCRPGRAPQRREPGVG